MHTATGRVDRRSHGHQFLVALVDGPSGKTRTDLIAELQQARERGTSVVARLVPVGAVTGKWSAHDRGKS